MGEEPFSPEIQTVLMLMSAPSIRRRASGGSARKNVFSLVPALFNMCCCFLGVVGYKRRQFLPEQVCNNSNECNNNRLHYVRSFGSKHAESLASTLDDGM